MKNNLSFFINHSKSLILKLGFGILVIGVFSVMGTSARFSDQEISSANNFAAGTLLTGMRSGQNNFVSNPLDMNLGDQVARDVYVQKLGSLDMNYQSSVEFLAGSDLDLCQSLDVRVRHNWYFGLPLFPGDHSQRQMDLKYEGSLAGLDVSNAFDGSYPYFSNIFYGLNEHWYYYQVSLPATASSTLENKFCEFEIKTDAWQIGGMKGKGFHHDSTLSSQIATGDWAPAAPSGLRILDHEGNDLGCGGVTDNRSIVIDWDDNVEADIDLYQLDLKDKDNHKRISVSEYPGTIRDIDGVYKYRIRAIDSNGNVSEPSEWCQVTLDRRTAESLVVINEFLPNPSGADDAAKPDGEWIELYNNGEFEFDLAGWSLYDSDDTHETIISTTNSDNNNNPFDAGETIIPAHGYLVVYRNGSSGFSLNNDGDDVRLFNDQISTGGVLVDGYTYTQSVPEDKSYARTPEGTGSFVDPIPTPGRRNVISQDQLDPSFLIWRYDQSYLRGVIFDALNYDRALIIVTYDHEQDGQILTDGFTKEIEINSNNLYFKDLYLGTRSGDDFNPHLNVSNIRIEMILSGGLLSEKSLEISL